MLGFEINRHSVTKVGMSLSSALLVPEGENKKPLYAQNVDLSGIKNKSSLTPNYSLLIDSVGTIKTVGKILNFS